MIPTAQRLFGQLRGVARRRDVTSVIVDLAEAGRLDTSGLAVLALAARMMARTGKAFDLAHVDDRHRAALELLPRATPRSPTPASAPT